MFRRISRWVFAVLAVGAGGAAVVAVGLVALFLFLQFADDAPPAKVGPNALWLGHTWVGDAHASSDYRALAQRLVRHRISDVYAHVGPLGEDGGIEAGKHHHAAAFRSALRALAPSVRVHAWMGQTEARVGGLLDIGSAAIRANIVLTAGRFADLGFDGIHYDIEPVYDGDRRFLDLLRRSNFMLEPRGVLLSVASDELSPFPIAEDLARLISPEAALWSAGYYQEVGAHVDQIAVMMYDTGLPSGWLYSGMSAWETWRLSSIIDEETTLFIGIPTYEDDRWSFNSRAENMSTGLHGVAIGARYASRPRNRFGVAIYSDWETTPDEWRVYRRKWLGRAN
jgi:hypothetical protein